MSRNIADSLRIFPTRPEARVFELRARAVCYRHSARRVFVYTLNLEALSLEIEIEWRRF